MIAFLLAGALAQQLDMCHSAHKRLPYLRHSIGVQLNLYRCVTH